MKLNLPTLFKFPLDERNFFKNLLICSLLMIFPILNFLVFGYFMLLYQSGMRRQTRALPDWVFRKDFLLRSFVLGVASSLASFVYAIPLLGLFLFSLSITPFNELTKVLGNLLLVVLYILSFCMIFFVPFVIGAYLEKESFQDVLNFKKILKNARNAIWDILKLYSVLIFATVFSAFVNNFSPYANILTIPFIVYVAIVVFRGLGEIYPFTPDSQETPNPSPLKLSVKNVLASSSKQKKADESPSIVHHSYTDSSEKEEKDIKQTKKDEEPLVDDEKNSSSSEKSSSVASPKEKASKSKATPSQSVSEKKKETPKKINKKTSLSSSETSEDKKTKS